GVDRGALRFRRSGIQGENPRQLGIGSDEVLRETWLTLAETAAEGANDAEGPRWTTTAVARDDDRAPQLCLHEKARQKPGTPASSLGLDEQRATATALRPEQPPPETLRLLSPAHE